MKKLLLLSALLIFACSSDSDSTTNVDCPDQPLLNTFEVSEINYDNDIDLANAVFSGEIQNIQLGTNCETFSVTNQGFVWSENIQPTISDNVVNVNGQNVSVNVNNLVPETTYYVRCYLTNILGTFYGNEVSFTTPQSTSPVYLDSNGITIKARDWANIGDVGIVNGVQYTIVNAVQLLQMLNNDEDVTKVCTSKINNLGYLTSEQPFDADFNQPIGSWDTSSVNYMAQLFSQAVSFNQPIGSWDTSNISDMNGMFDGAVSFNQDISDWDTSNVTTMYSMFYGAESFNQPIGNWDTSNVTDMGQMFVNTTFNKPIGNWDVSSVTKMTSMFVYNPVFNQDISDWDTINVTNMNSMFYGAESFNQPIGNWDVSSVTNMSHMLGNYETTLSFNQDISDWDVSSVTDMSYMFRSSIFNQDISNWDTSNVTTMYSMFINAESFNQDISDWDVNNVTNCSEFSNGATAWTLPQPNFTNCNPN